MIPFPGWDPCRVFLEQGRGRPRDSILWPPGSVTSSPPRAWFSLDSPSPRVQEACWSPNEQVFIQHLLCIRTELGQKGSKTSSVSDPPVSQDSQEEMMSDRCQAQQVRVWGNLCRGDSWWVWGVDPGVLP